jgi:RsiW-degrading membrane proteinase PrsW (M82 family)
MTDLGVALLDLVILVLVALAPALIYLVWIRQTERMALEPWGLLLRLFLFGALGATIIAAILELVIVDVGTAISLHYPAPEFAFLNGNSSLGAFFLVLVVAPFVEEALKASGVVQYRAWMRRVADGPVFGASVGLGFGFFETLLYGVGAFLVGGLAAGIALIFVRSISSVLLHGSSTAMFGRGYAASVLEKRPGASGAYYLLAVAMHSTFNVLASLAAILAAFGLPNSFGPYVDLIGLFGAIAFAFGAISHVGTVITQSDFPGASAVHPRYRPPAATPKQYNPPRR